jgi:hypothetical protein
LNPNLNCASSAEINPIPSIISLYLLMSALLRADALYLENPRPIRGTSGQYYKLQLRRSSILFGSTNCRSCTRDFHATAVLF